MKEVVHEGIPDDVAGERYSVVEAESYLGMEGMNHGCLLTGSDSEDLVVQVGLYYILTHQDLLVQYLIAQLVMEQVDHFGFAVQEADGEKMFAVAVAAVVGVVPFVTGDPEV